MKQPKRPLGLLKKKALADKTKVSKMVKDPKVGPNYSEFNKSGTFKTSKPNSQDTADYKAGYRKGVSNARSGKLIAPDKKGNPTQVWYGFRNQSGIPLVPGRNETARFAEGRFEGEKRGKKNK